MPVDIGIVYCDVEVIYDADGLALLYVVMKLQGKVIAEWTQLVEIE